MAVLEKVKYVLAILEIVFCLPNGFGLERAKGSYVVFYSAAIDMIRVRDFLVYTALFSAERQVKFFLLTRN